MPRTIHHATHTAYPYAPVPVYGSATGTYYTYDNTEPTHNEHLLAPYTHQYSHTHENSTHHTPYTLPYPQPYPQHYPQQYTQHYIQQNTHQYPHQYQDPARTPIARMRDVYGESGTVYQ